MVTPSDGMIWKSMGKSMASGIPRLFRVGCPCKCALVVEVSTPQARGKSALKRARSEGRKDSKHDSDGDELPTK
eukprot:scaffold187035_cov18-Tisochrysis_lutea.AAC.1